MDLRKVSMPNFKKMDKKLINKLAMVLLLIIIIVIAIIVIKLFIGNRTTYSNIETRMVTAAKKYFSEDEEGINKFKSINDGTITVSVETLIENKYLKELTKIIPAKDKDTTCTGNVSVKMNNGYALYTPHLKCTNYETKKLKDVITSNTVQISDGLYLMGDNYVFRGEKVNNYVSFANKTWMIIRVNSDGTIKMIETTKRNKIVWDNRYNTQIKSNSGINDFTYNGQNSRIKDSLIKLYNNEKEFTNSDKSYIVPQTLCIGKRSINDTDNSGKIECSQTEANWMIGLIQVNEYLTASLDPNCKRDTDAQCSNYNYLEKLNSSYWSITASSEKTNKVYKMTPSPTSTSASGKAGIRAVILIDANSIYVKGDGTEENPYIFK